MRKRISLMSATLLAVWACSGGDAGGEAEADAPSAGEAAGAEAEAPVYRGQLGDESPKIRTEGGATFVYAAGDPKAGEDVEWFEFTDALIPAAELQSGSGRYTTTPVTDPVFVPPDDPRLLEVAATSRYQGDAVAASNDEIIVLGYVEEGEAKAYPIALMERHEVVNDRISGKPISVGW